MTNVILHFQNEQTDKHTSITITQEQLRQFALGSVQTKWAMKHGQNQPISVISDFDLVAENVSNINPNNTLTMIVTDDGYERKQYTVEDSVKVREQTLENGTLTLHYDNQSQIRPLRELYR